MLVWCFLCVAGTLVLQGGGNGWAYLPAGPTSSYIVGVIAAKWLVGNFVVYVPGLLWIGAFGLVS